MLENIFSGFVGAALALILRWAFELIANLSYRRKIAALCVVHLERIEHALKAHIKVVDNHAWFGETQYHEAVVGHFLYDLITSNIDRFCDLQMLGKTMTFFHHYKVNMSTVRGRLDEVGKGQRVTLTEGTYNNLLNYLKDATNELSQLRDMGFLKSIWNCIVFRVHL